MYVVDNQVVDERWGSEPHTTNNRMELSALINACALVPEGKQAVLYTDSQLCVSTINEWAKGWEARGWKAQGRRDQEPGARARAVRLLQAPPRARAPLDRRALRQPLERVRGRAGHGLPPQSALRRRSASRRSRADPRSARSRPTRVEARLHGHGVAHVTSLLLTPPPLPPLPPLPGTGAVPPHMLPAALAAFTVPQERTTQ